MKLTVIVPVYNAEKTLVRCIDSIIKQDVTDLELLLINDGSKDKSPEILNDYAARYPFVRVINKENGGEASARNKGLELATGDYIAWVDSDDELEPMYYYTVIDALVKNNYPQLAITGQTYVDVDATRRVGKPTEAYVSREQFAHDFFDNPWKADLRVVWNKFFRKDIVKDILFEKRVSATDYLFCLNAYIKADRICFVPTSGYLQYMNANSITHRLDKRYDEIHELESSRQYHKKADSLMKQIGITDEQIYDEHCKKDYVWFYILVKNIVNPGTPYVTNKSKRKQIRQIMDEQPYADCIQAGKPKTKLERLIKLLYKINSKRLVLFVFKIIVGRNKK